MPLSTHHPRERVLITGMGAVSSIGVGVPAFIAAIRAGASGVRPLEFAHEKVKSTVSAAVPRGVFDPRSVMDEGDLGRLPRLIPMGLAACREALGQSGLRLSEAEAAEPAGGWLERSRRIGLILGTGGGGIDFTLDQYAAAYGGKHASLWTITNATHGNLAGELSIRLGLRGPSWCVSTGCASTSDAIGMALETLRHSTRLDAIVVVGADAHVRWETLHTMELLRVISTRDLAAEGEDPTTASRPFDATRDGFVLGEGAWAAVLERGDALARRDGRAIGEVLGYGATCDAYHRVRPDPDMTECVRAMREAIADAGLEPEDIGVVHYHGTSTKMNDAAETKAVKLAFGEHAARLRGHSVKGALGHPQGACGGAALVTTLGAMTNQDGSERGAFLPPTLHVRNRDPECDLDYTSEGPEEAAAAVGGAALINCLAFGAKNSAVVVKAAR